MSEPTVDDVAQWLLNSVLKKCRGGHRAYQYVVARELRAEFGDAWVYKNANGNRAIDPRVLARFRKLPGWEQLQWNRGDQSWQIRRERQYI